ncbi:MAG: HXXEE domain-containing protein [Ignavibacteriaceae bacterium]|nr:HXXEE domain-containing protein [Ignavibacteriaceae bacterium]
MTEPVFISVKILFLLGFTLHNLEEAVWLPKWSEHAKKFHKPVSSNEFIFADIIITMLGYIFTGLDILFYNPGNILHYFYLGFIGMMGINSIFPHLAATLVIKKYSPGLLTGLFLNLPLSIIITAEYLNTGINPYLLITSIVIVSSSVLVSLKYLFKLGHQLFDY